VTTQPTEPAAAAVRTDWVLFALPVVFALRTFNTRGTIFILAVMALYVVTRKHRAMVAIAPGPLALLAAATALVLGRPTPGVSATVYGLIILVLVAVIAVAAAIQNDARAAISSLINGLGLYLLMNVLGHLAGLKSPGAGDRVGAVNESSGFTRVIFPFTTALDEAATVAAVFVAAVPILLVAERHWRWFRVACLAAGILVAWSGASRTALLIAVALPVIYFSMPRVLRWIGQVAALFAATSAVLLPPIMEFSGKAVAPVLKVLAPGRDTASGDVESLSNRSKIWSRSLDFWNNHVHTWSDQLFGFGQTGQFRSGVSLTYADILSEASRYPRLGTVHNAFLQQLFDGGVVGWGLLTLCTLWTALRLANRLADWGPYARAAVVAFAALMFSSTVSVPISPGLLQMGYFLLLMLVAISCQVARPAPAPPSAEPLPAEPNGNGSLGIGAGGGPTIPRTSPPTDRAKPPHGQRGGR
jgi:hypothetical protein